MRGGDPVKESPVGYSISVVAPRRPAPEAIS